MVDISVFQLAEGFFCSHSENISVQAFLALPGLLLLIVSSCVSSSGSSSCRPRSYHTLAISGLTCALICLRAGTSEPVNVNFKSIEL